MVLLTALQELIVTDLPAPIKKWSIVSSENIGLKKLKCLMVASQTNLKLKFPALFGF